MINILITNDDGLYAKGLATLIEFTQDLGNITVIAPSTNQSGKSNAITIDKGLTINSFKKNGINYHECSGTPVDCVKICKSQLIDFKPDILLSGINNGSNLAINVLYSGTMAAAMEGMLIGINAIGFSMINAQNLEEDYKHARILIRKLIIETIKSKRNQPICYNVNFPYKQNQPIKGIKYCHQTNSYWKENYTKKNGKYFIGGDFIVEDKSQHSDIWATDNNYMSVVPVQLDFTNYNLLKKLNNEEI